MRGCFEMWEVYVLVLALESAEVLFVRIGLEIEYLSNFFFPAKVCDYKCYTRYEVTLYIFDKMFVTIWEKSYMVAAALEKKILFPSW